jgi:hypothetical protein
MRAAEEMASFVQMCSDADVRRFPVATRIVAVVRYVFGVRFGAVSESWYHLLDVRWVRL